MLNPAIEELNKLIHRLEMLFQVQTHEVVQDLKKIREMLVVTEPQKEIKQDKQQKLEKVADTTETIIDLNVEWEETIITPTITESKEDVVKRYIEKFNKKPFAWWSIEVLKEKLGE